MLGREMDRVERVFLHGDAPLDTLLLETEHEGLVALGETPLAEFLAGKRPAGTPQDGYYLIDPLGKYPGFTERVELTGPEFRQQFKFAVTRDKARDIVPITDEAKLDAVLGKNQP